MINAPHDRDNDHENGDKTNQAGVAACADGAGCLTEARRKCFGDINSAHVSYFPIKSKAKGLIVLGSIAGLLI